MILMMLIRIQYGQDESFSKDNPIENPKLKSMSHKLVHLTNEENQQS